MDRDSAARRYVLGHTDHELARLERQAEIFAEPTADALRRAGIKQGMRVLDLGCGVGDVSLIAAGLVGPAGRVLGLDRADEAIRTATARASGCGYPWVTFAQADVTALTLTEPWDAVVGRFILMHLPDPVAVLSNLRDRLGPKGILAFLEMDVGSALAVPELPLFATCISWITSVYRRAGMEPDMGSRLYGAFCGAGLVPAVTGSCRIEGGPDARAYDYVTESLRSLSTSIVSLGVATEAEMDLPTLSARLKAAAVAGGHCFIFPRLVAASARVPG